MRVDCVRHVFFTCVAGNICNQCAHRVASSSFGCFFVNACCARPNHCGRCVQLEIYATSKCAVTSRLYIALFFYDIYYHVVRDVDEQRRSSYAIVPVEYALNRSYCTRSTRVCRTRRSTKSVWSINR